MDNLIRRIWPGWELQEELGRGSFGTVYRAVYTGSGPSRSAAVKIISIPQNDRELDTLRAEGMHDDAIEAYYADLVTEFTGEISLMTSLEDTAHIVRVDSWHIEKHPDSIGWTIVIRMELLTPLYRYTCDQQMDESQVLALGLDICTALEDCSAQGIVHRDIKPDNIFVSASGAYKLGDFGSARRMDDLINDLSQKGTYNYMAPEIVTSRDYDARADLYSLGIVLYRLLNRNRLPFLDPQKRILTPADRRTAIERRLQGDVLPSPQDASPEMADLILRACAYLPENRFRSASAMKRALEQVRDGTYLASTPHEAASASDSGPETAGQTQTAVQPVPRTTGSSRRFSRHILIPAAVCLLAFLLCAGAFFMHLPRRSGRPDLISDPDLSLSGSAPVLPESSAYPRITPPQQEENISSVSDTPEAGFDWVVYRNNVTKRIEMIRFPSVESSSFIRFTPNSAEKLQIISDTPVDTCRRFELSSLYSWEQISSEQALSSVHADTLLFSSLRVEGVTGSPWFGVVDHTLYERFALCDAMEAHPDTVYAWIIYRPVNNAAPCLVVFPLKDKPASLQIGADSRSLSNPGGGYAQYTLNDYCIWEYQETENRTIRDIGVILASNIPLSDESGRILSIKSRDNAFIGFAVVEANRRGIVTEFSLSGSYLYVIDACSWSEALLQAASYGGTLLTLDSSEEFNLVTSELDTLGVDNIEFRIGARRAQNSDLYYWTDRNNSLLPFCLNQTDSWTSGFWQDGEPSLSYQNNPEEVVELVVDSDTGQWLFNDIPDSVYGTSGRAYGYIVKLDNPP